MANNVTVARPIVSSALTHSASGMQAVGVPPPQWTGTPAPSITAGVAGSYTLPVSANTSTVTWLSPGGKPSWLSFSGRTMSWTSAAQDSDDIANVVLRASNTGGYVDSAQFNLTVAPGALPTPVWTATPSPTIYAGQASSYTLPVTNAVSVAWAGPGAKPSWISFSGASMVWNGTQAATDDISGVTLTATNASGSTTSPPFNIDVVPLPAVGGYFAGYTPVRKALATVGSEAPTSGLPYGAKHTTFVTHPNGRAYLFGGDWAPSGSIVGAVASSGNQTQYSYDHFSGWRLEHNFWPPSGTVPLHHDKSAVAWDSKRRRFWMVGGFNFVRAGTTPPMYDSPTAAVPTVGKVMYFDPAKPVSTQWTDTGVAYNTSNDPEGFGEAVYDPVLDVVISYIPSAWWWSGQIWDCASSAWLGKFTTSNPNFEIVNSGFKGSVLAIDPPARKLYVIINTTYNTYKAIGEITLPSSRAALPLAGTTATWTVTTKWTNTNAHNSHGGVMLRRNGLWKYYFWLKGPVGNDANAPGTDIGGAYYGNSGRPFTNNGVYGSANTGVIVDVSSGQEEFTQLPLHTFADGIGWVLPNETHWIERDDTVWYGTAQFEGADAETPYKYVEPNLIVARKALPSWVANLPLYRWYAIPGSVCETDLPSDIRTNWTGPEASGHRNNELTVHRSPWSFSGMAFRRKDSVCMFHGGGGGDGRSNGVLGFVLNSETPYWINFMPPAPRSQTIDTWTGTGAGGPYTYEFNHTAANHLVESVPKTPVACHAYHGCHFDDAEDVWLRYGTQMVWPTDQGSFYGVHGIKWSEFSKPLDSRVWTLNVRPDTPSNSSPPPTYLKHPWTEDIYGGVISTVYRYNKSVQSWSGRLDWDAMNGRRASGIDPVNNLLIVPPTSGSTAAPVVIKLDGTGALADVITGSWTGSSEWASVDVPYAWDDDNQCLWALKARSGADSSFDLFKIQTSNAATGQFFVTLVSTDVFAGQSKPTFSGSGFISPSNRFKWVPELGGLVFSMAYSHAVYFIRTSIRS